MKVRGKRQEEITNNEGEFQSSLKPLILRIIRIKNHSYTLIFNTRQCYEYFVPGEQKYFHSKS